MKNETQPKNTPAQGAWSVIDQALNHAFQRGVFDRQDSKVINAAMDVLAASIRMPDATPAPPEATPTPVMRVEKGGKND